MLGEGREPYLEASGENTSIILGWGASAASGMGSRCIVGRRYRIRGKALETAGCKGLNLLDLISECPINRQDCTASPQALQVGVGGLSETERQLVALLNFIYCVLTEAPKVVVGGGGALLSAQAMVAAQSLTLVQMYWQWHVNDSTPHRRGAKVEPGG